MDDLRDDVMTSEARHWIDHLGLQPHPEGGWYVESWRAATTVATPRGERAAGTAIYFLLNHGDRSHLHRLAADEIWHFYAGDPLLIQVITAGDAQTLPLGPDCLQQRVPAGTWFGAELAPASSWCLVGCTMAPGFDFADFELGTKPQLLASHPAQFDLIERLCLEEA